MTKSQIEAVLAEFSDELTSSQRKLITAELCRLTAAEVGYQKWKVGDYDPHRHARHAAAEVGDVGKQQQQQRLKDEELVLLRKAYDSGVADERERCAQVADRFTYSWEGKEIATAIRKGDKP